MHEPLPQGFWKNKTLHELTDEEWEALCDGCARCCLHKLEYETTGDICYTCIVCRYLDEETCRCTRYAERTVLVPTCVRLQPTMLGKISFLPITCAYRIIMEGKDLPWWHPLISGSSETVHEAGISVRGKVVREDFVHPEGWEEMIVDWVK